MKKIKDIEDINEVVKSIWIIILIIDHKSTWGLTQVHIKIFETHQG